VWIKAPAATLKAPPAALSTPWAYYPFNGNANDASGNGRTGTLSGAGASVTAAGLRTAGTSGLMNLPAQGTAPGHGGAHPVRSVHVGRRQLGRPLAHAVL
jgi:hypothetical protein